MKLRQHSAIDQSTATFHFVASENRKRGLVAFVCERQPLMTFQSNGLPAHCPVCGTQNPLVGKQEKI
jgi:hypothetical protein